MSLRRWQSVCCTRTHTHMVVEVITQTKGYRSYVCVRAFVYMSASLFVSSLAAGHVKGLHDCNSPMCTLSQNGYGTGEGPVMRGPSVGGWMVASGGGSLFPPVSHTPRAWVLHTFDVARSGLAIGRCCCRGPVAQWIRHRPTEPGIAGSSPAGVIIFESQPCHLHVSSRQT